MRGAAVRAFLAAAIFAAGVVVASAAGPATASPPSPSPPPSAAATPAGSPPPTTSPSPSPSSSPSPAATATQPPIVVNPAAAEVPVGSERVVQAGSVLGTITAAAADPTLVGVRVDQVALTVTLTGKAPGTTVVTVTDQRGMTANVPVRVAYKAGSVAATASIRITGDPASSLFVKRQAVAAATALARLRPGAQVVTGVDDVSFDTPLAQDDVATLNVPILIQGKGYFGVRATTAVRVTNMAAPKIRPRSLMVSDYPEKLEADGVLFTADLKREQPSRFLYFHYNPPGEPDRRIVLQAVNRSPEPAIVQFISGAGGPGKNEMEVGHDSTRRFLVRLVQNEGRIIEIPGYGTMNLSEQELPAKNVVCNLLQLRVLNGSVVRLTLFAENASASHVVPAAGGELLHGTQRHARGIYAIPEFHYSALWSVTDPYLELPIGQIPLPNLMRGEALSGDYGVLQSFVVMVENPTAVPQPIAIYENPRGGYATGTYLIDGVLVQSHQVPPFSRYKIRQYVVPAKGFVRVTIETIPEGGSSYPLRLILAPDDGSVPPGAPGSPVY